MKFKLSNYYVEDIKNKPIYKRPFFYYILFIIIMIITAVAHPYDMEWKNYVLNLRNNYGTPTLESFIDVIKLFGDGKTLGFIAAVMGAVGLRRIGWRIVLTLLLMGIMVGILKPAVHRERPNGRNDFSFPSGDSATATALVVPLAAEIPVLAPLVVIAPAVAFCRNWANWHYLSDVIAGIAFGILATGFAFKIDIRKNKFIGMFKSRHLALLSVLLALIFFLPDMFKASGKFFDFMGFYGSALMLWFAANYAQMFFKERSDKCKPADEFIMFITKFSDKYKIVGKFSKILTKRLEKCEPNKLAMFCKKLITKYAVKNFSSVKFVVIDLCLIIFSIIVLAFTWTTNMGDLNIAMSGLPILLIFSVIYRRRLVYKKRFIKASTVPFLTCFLFVLFALITLLPAVIRYYSR
ncbi:MAG TPA: phosphatase PAP2 family protein [Victivallales bacterium]|nr:phosphatase PAP2 family protein [Victivallales bacterium]